MIELQHYQRTGATVISNFEICQWLATRGVKNTHPMNLGGSYNFPFGRLTMTLALHSSALPDGAYGGNPCGFCTRRVHAVDGVPVPRYSLRRQPFDAAGVPNGRNVASQSIENN